MDETLKNFLLSIRNELSEKNKETLDSFMVVEAKKIKHFENIVRKWLNALDRAVSFSVILNGENNVAMFDINHKDEHYEFHIPRAMSFNDAELEILDNILQASLFYTDNPESAEPWQRSRVRYVATLLLKLERNI